MFRPGALGRPDTQLMTIFLALTGTQGVTISVCPSVCPFYKVLSLHLSGSAVTSQSAVSQSELINNSSFFLRKPSPGVRCPAPDRGCVPAFLRAPGCRVRCGSPQCSQEVPCGHLHCQQESLQVRPGAGHWSISSGYFDFCRSYSHQYHYQAHPTGSSGYQTSR